jgi:soluble lytic murein transglycosylase
MHTVRLFASAVAGASVFTFCGAAAAQQPAPVQPFPPQVRPVYQPAPPSAAVAVDIQQWSALRSGSSASFETYANFILSHRGWPGETDLRRRAERQVVVGGSAIGDVVRFFTALPPLTAQGQAAYALALQSSGQMARAAEVARAAWTMGSMPQEFEQRLQSVFPGQLRPADHDRRADVLLDAGDMAGAQRAMAYGSGQRSALHRARMALQSRAPDAVAQAASLPPALSRDIGLAYDRASYTNRSGDPLGARQTMAQRPTSDRPAGSPERLMEFMVSLARGAANDGQSRLAFDIAAKVDDIYPAGTDVSARPYGERDEYTNLTWLGGRTALAAGRPADAIGMFDRYGRAGASPQTRAKGAYWAGHAAGLAGQAQQSRDFLSRAARYPDQFYGQLAADRLGQSIRVPAPDAPVSAAERQAFEGRSLVAAVRYLGATGSYTQQSLFIRALADAVATPGEQFLAGELGRQIGRRDLGVWTARAARQDGDDEIRRFGYPTLTVPPAQQRLSAVIHGITRTESQYDVQAQSPVGARGLMQLMPGTAASVSRQVGQPYGLGRLTSDPAYNVQLGSQYFQTLLDNWGGSYPLAVASYNAGPGNVRRWINQNGDPRGGGVDMIEWMEKIPITETRNYVQRVLESAVVYDLLYGNQGRDLPSGRLSQYLGIVRR